MKHFSMPTEALGALDAETAARLIAAAADVTLVLDRDGVIRDVAVNGAELTEDLDGPGRWIGRPWVETVTIESRPKVEALMKEAVAGLPARSRQVNYASSQQADVPMLYSAVAVGLQGRIVAFGRNLQPVSTMQRRLVEAQQTMERDYSRMRHVEMRYRLLFRISAEPVLIVDAASRKVVEANPAAGALFGDTVAGMLNRPLVEIFEPAAAGPVESLMAVVQAAGRGDDVQATLKAEHAPVLVSAHLFRQEGTASFLIRLSRLGPEGEVGRIPKMAWKLLKLVESAPDGFVVTDAEGRIMSANVAFVDMAQLATEQQVLNQKLDRWLGRPGIDLSVLIANVRERGAVRLFASTVQGDFGSEIVVEISAATVMNGERQCFGFAIRDVGRRLRSEVRSGPELPRSVAQLTELVGRVSLKDLVREATDVIEKLSIEAALQMTGGNRASAAEMLGVSRQSLYVKLRRYGVADVGNGNGIEGD